MPQLSDPKEWAIIRSMYFNNDGLREAPDPLEEWDRIKHKRTENQAR